MSEKVEMTPGIRALWREDLLLDFTIEVEDKEFKVHKVVMAGLCDYFKAMFRAGMKESQQDRVRLEGFSALAVSNMIKYIYTSQFGYNIGSAEELLKLAVYLQFPRGIESMEDHLCEETVPSNCLSSLSLFKSFSLKEGIERTVLYIKEHFVDVMAEYKPDTLPLEDFMNLMDCWNRSEWELFELAKEWLQIEERKQHVNEVMSHVRFPLLSPPELASIKDMDIYTSCSGSWRELIDKALVYHSLPTHKKVTDDSDETKVRMEPTPVCFPADYDADDYLYSQEDKWSWKTVECSKNGQTNTYPMPELKRSWQMYETFNRPEFQEEPLVVVANNFLIVREYDNQWHIFDPRTLTWSPMAAMGTERMNCALVYHEKYLYVLGGALSDGPGGYYRDHRVTDIIERYDFETDTWTIIPSKLPVPLQGHAALSVAGAIYVTGGWKSSMAKEDFSQRMDCFDPSTDTWRSKPAMRRTTRALKIQLMKLCGKEVIFVLDENLTVQYYNPSSNNWCNEWSVWHGRRRGGLFNQLVSWYDKGKVVATGRYLYLLNFTDHRGFIHACVRWDFHEYGEPEIIEVSVDDFPVCEEDKDDSEREHFCALLSINHKYVKKTETSPASTSDQKSLQSVLPQCSISVPSSQSTTTM